MKKRLSGIKIPNQLILLVIGLIWATFGYAQTHNVTGTVKDENSSPIEGANISEKGKKNIVTSDAEGHFSIEVSNKNVTLVISYVDKQTKEIALAGHANVTITLSSASSGLSDVVVTTAMGIKRADRNIGYSVSSVKGAELTKAREPSALAGLVGKVAGVSVGPSAEMLGTPQVVLRGNNNIMYVIDGVPVNSDSWNISPDDIESYTILKGQNAAALYGFRGQNGAIVITTKRGTKNGRGWAVSVNSSTMVESGFLALPKPQDEYGRGTGYKYAFAAGYDYGKRGTDVAYDNAQRLPIWGPRFEGQPVRQYDSPYDPTTGVRTATPYTARGANNLKNFLQTGILSTNNVSASASGENYDLRMSYSHMYQKGTDPNTKLNIDNLNILTEYRFSKKFSAEANLNFNEQYTPNIPDPSYGPNSYVYELSVYGSTDYDIRSLKDYWKGPMGVPGVMQYSENYGRDKRNRADG